MKANLGARPNRDLMQHWWCPRAVFIPSWLLQHGCLSLICTKTPTPYQLGSHSWLLSSHPWAQRELMSELGSRDIDMWSSLRPWALSTFALTYGYQHCKPHTNCACDLSLCCFMEILLLSVFCLGNVRQNTKKCCVPMASNGGRQVKCLCPWPCCMSWSTWRICRENGRIFSLLSSKRDPYKVISRCGCQKWGNISLCFG